MIPNNQGLNLSNHTDLFTKANGTDKYICPICNGNDLSIHKTSGKFNCYNSDGQCNSEIRKYVIEQLGIDSPKENNYSGSFTKIGIDFYSRPAKLRNDYYQVSFLIDTLSAIMGGV
jgi:hypothetical protein